MSPDVDLIGQLLSQSPRRLIPEFTVGTLPDAMLYPGCEIIILDYAGGSRWRSNGTRWRPASSIMTIGELNTQVLVGATAAQTMLYGVLLPAPLIGPKDRVECFTHGVRSANTSQTTFRLLLGGTGTDGAIVSARAETSSVAIGSPFIFGFSCMSSLFAQRGFGAGGIGATQTSNQQTAVDLSVSQYVYLTAQKTNAGDVAGADIISFRLLGGGE